MAIMIAAILTVSIGLSVSLIPSASAHTPPLSWPTYSYLAVNPNPTGIGQTVNVGFWVNTPPATANGVYGDRWTNYTVKVTEPNGGTETLGPFTSDDTGGTHTDFTPSQVGNYTFQFFFPQQTLLGHNVTPGISQAVASFINDTYEASQSPVVTLTVQQAPITLPPSTPLPTGYWQRPISALNANWYTIGGNCLGLRQSTFSNTGMYNATGNYNPYTTAPLTAHILWTKPVAFGGTVGGDFGGPTVEGTTTSNFYSASQYEPKYDPVILNGILYYEEYPGSNQDPTGITAVNLQTGQTLWTDTNLPYQVPWYLAGPTTYSNDSNTGVIPYTTTLRAGQILDDVTPNQYGGEAYLWFQLPADQDMLGIIPTLPGHYIPLPGQKTGNATSNDGYQGPGTLAQVNPPRNPATSPPNQQGALWGMAGSLDYYAFSPWEPQNVTYALVDAMTGTPVLSIVNAVPFSQISTDAQGDLLGYYYNFTTYPYPSTFSMWNSTQAIEYPNGKTAAFQDWYQRPVQGAKINFAAGIMYTADLPTTSPSGVALPDWNVGSLGGVTINWALTDFTGNTIIFTDQNGQSPNAFFNPGWEIEAGFNALTGASLFVVNQTLSADTRMVVAPGTSGNGVYIEITQDSMVMNAYSLITGKLVWGPVSLAPFDAYDSDGINYVIAGAQMYLWGLGGDVWSINMANGTVNWKFTTGSAGEATPYGVWPIWTFTVGTVAGGVLYLPEGHQYSPPLFHGAQQLALNITTGKLIWSIDSFDVTSGPAISDGIMTTLNAYDNQIYAYGKGQTATTVTTSPVQNNAAQILVKGTVTDQSPGQTCLGIPAAGTPAVSDASMTQWMEYLYMQQPEPTNVTGVPVTLTDIDPNGNSYVIGQTTSNSAGQYSYTFTPNIAGTYTIIATFAGSNSYYSSTAQTTTGFASPAVTAPTAAPVTGLASTSTVELGIVAVIIVIIVIGAILAILQMRKRP